MFEREDRETKQDQKNYRLARANGCFSGQSVASIIADFTQITVTKGARTGRTRIAERKFKAARHRQPAA